ncbi:MAG TPA: AraC family transcriptional regulator [Accumulibacter sp.]|nr:AraC family transcriptional regulator [Accumulibacter sp.]
MSSAPPISVHTGFVRETLGGLAMRQQDPQAFLERANIHEELIKRPLARISGSQYQSLVLALMDDLDDEMMGHLNRPMRRGAFVFLARASLIGAISLYVVLSRWVKAHRLLTDEVQISFNKGNEVAWITLTGGSRSGGAYPTFLPMVYFKSLHILASWLIGERIKLTEVRFSGPSPIHGDEYAHLFPGDIVFSAPISAMGIPAHYLDRAVNQDNDSLNQFFRGAPGNLLWQYRATDLLSEKIRAILKDALPAPVDIATAARMVGFSQRTLHRRLIDEGTNFQEIKDGLRRDVAIDCLDHSRLSIEEIAGLVGFSDAAVFYRAFKTWTGVAPGVYRQRTLKS